MLLATLVASVVLASAPTSVPAPGEALSLQPGPPPSVRTAGPVAPARPVNGTPLFPGGAAIAGAGVAGTVLRRRRHAGTSLPTVPADVVVVFVSGHGSTYGDTFDSLIAGAGLPPDQVRHFDYRLVVPTVDHVRASQDASVEEVADGLSAYLAGVAASDSRRIYLVGFSKGGASIAELLAQWDEHPGRRVPTVVGAALLDPPIATGGLGDLQSIGRLWGRLPDDGGYQPERCTWFGLRCHDRRVQLGRAAGVEVVVFRNPDAVVTSFTDRPEGLRVYDVADPGPSAWRQLVTDPLGVFGRIGAAHHYPQQSAAVAGCIRRELWRPGSCPGLERASGGGRRRR